ncbi:MAG: phospholipid-binding protein MlaC [Alphaproteobacteria bacterium]
MKRLGDDAVAVLTAPESSAGERKQRYRDLLEEGFAVRTIARFVLGRYWRAATPEQQSEYLVLFRDFILESYTSQLDGFTGETFEILQAQPLGEKDTIVSTEIRAPNRAPVRVDYRVRRSRSGHKIIDVVIEGISLIKTQRSEFASVIDRKGIDGLLALLRERTGQTTTSN